MRGAAGRALHAGGASARRLAPEGHALRLRPGAVRRLRGAGGRRSAPFLPAAGRRRPGPDGYHRRGARFQCRWARAAGRLRTPAGRAVRLLHQRHPDARTRLPAHCAGRIARSHRAGAGRASVPLRLASPDRRGHRGGMAGHAGSGLMQLQLPPALAAQPDPALWLAFEASGRVTVRTGKVELGQGILTALCQLVADGLGVEPAQVDMRSASTHRWPNEGFTVGSLSTEQSGPVMCTVGAVLRWRLLQAASRALDLPFDELEVRAGEVLHRGRATGWSYASQGQGLLARAITAEDR